MKNTCLGFPISKGRMNHRIAKSLFRSFYVAGFNNFKVKDYDKSAYELGSLAHDCDGFNHYICAIEPEYTTISNIRGEVLCGFTFYKEDGSAFCHVSPPRTQQEIIAWYKMLSANRDSDPWKFTERYEELYGKDFTIAENGTIVRSK
jgi:hypothetical protein